MALLTTLIPAYKKEHLGDVFLGLSRQSFRDFEVILSDDSPNAEITRLINEGHFGDLTQKLNLSIVRGPCNARRNHEQLLDLWGGRSPLVHLHLDDDIIFPDFYRTHIEAHSAGDFCASVTPRWLSNPDGTPASTPPLPEYLVKSNQRIVVVDQDLLVQTAVAGCNNWAGEFSNMVFSIQGAKAYPKPPDGELNYYGLLDLGTLLEGVQKLPIAFVRDHQSVFRQHPAQTTHNRRTHGGRIARLSWMAYALHAWAQGRISAPQTIQVITITCRLCVNDLGDDPIVDELLRLMERNQDLPALHRAFTQFWLTFLASDPSTTPRPNSSASAGQNTTRNGLDSNESYCPLCHKSGAGFSPLPDYYRSNALAHGFPHFGKGEMTALETYSCSCCGASDRERLYAYWIDLQLKSGKLSTTSRVIHFAPEATLSSTLKQLKLGAYHTSDLMMEGCDYKADLLDMPFKDESYDFFICSHVLEHVASDDKAIAELYRITKTDGFGILMAPIIAGLAKTLEDSTITDESGRWRNYGQHDHVRLYAHDDYVNKIKRHGFTVQELGEEHFGRRVFAQLGLKRTSILYIVSKESSIPRSEA